MQRLRAFLAGLAVGHGLVSQTAVSAGNLMVSVLVARTAGPSGLGAVFVGFSCYLLAAGFQRALLVDPLIAASGRTERTDAPALGAALGYETAVALLMTAAGLLVGGAVGRGLLAFGLCAVPALLQELLRALLFRDGRGRAAAGNDVIWLLTTALLAWPAVRAGSPTAVVAAWGAGALVAATSGLLALGTRPGGFRTAVAWWRGGAWLLGRWLSLAGVVYALCSQAFALAVVALLGTGALGGVRAVQTLFAPLSLLAPALSLSALPALSRTAALQGAGPARWVALRVSALAAALTLAYTLPFAAVADVLLGRVFGAGFVGYDALVLPVAVGQAIVACLVGLDLLAKVLGRGGTLLTAQAVTSVVTLAVACAAGAWAGLTEVVWALPAGYLAGGLVLTRLLRAGSPSSPRPAAAPSGARPTSAVG